jgi:bifunctional aspartokinase / homoserine dehydrogenase 1
MQVLKFGGSSVANSDNMNKVMAIVTRAIKKDTTLVVVSALGGITDLLLQCGKLAAAGNEAFRDDLQVIESRHLDMVKALLPVSGQSNTLSRVMQQCNLLEDICQGIFNLRECSPRTRDWLMSFGELLSSQILVAALNARQVNAMWKDSRELIITDASYGYAAVDFVKTNDNIWHWGMSLTDKLVVLPGFIASEKDGATTTLGRGGSDYTGAILAAAANASVLEIWTDVSGMMTADPRLVSNARGIPHISYQEAMELSHFGAKVIYPPTVQPVMAKNIPVWVKNTFAPDDYGTLIENSAREEDSIIRGISSINHIAMLSLEGSGMVGIPGFSKRFFEALSNERINVILITQSSSEHSICVAVDAAAADRAKTATDLAFASEISSGQVDPLVVETGHSIIALVGDHMKNHTGTSGKMFSALGKNGVNIRAIAQGSSERNISSVIFARDVKKAVNVLHEEFFETSYKQINLFLCGTGNVGEKLLAQLLQQQAYLQQHLRLQLRVVGIANSKKMVFNDEGIDLSNWSAALEAGEPMQTDAYMNNIINRNLRNSVFADLTASGLIARQYDNLLSRSIAVVACNKVACSSDYVYYRKLKDLAREYGTSFLFETNVGAGLPVIGTLNDLLRSGDRIHRMEAVLSGTLNYVFNQYNGEESFASIVRRAQAEGYTEPDPRLDLNGTDVLRKIMILCRETGVPTEAADITNESFLPPSCLTGSVADFYQALEAEEPFFAALYASAKAAGKKLRFVASYDEGRAKVGLQQIGTEHDLYHLYGKDNVVLFYTSRYTEQPLVIKGAGAGAEVTASGVFADIMRSY